MAVGIGEVLQTRNSPLVLNPAHIVCYVACLRLRVGVELLQNCRLALGEAMNVACLYSTVPALFKHDSSKLYFVLSHYDFNMGHHQYKSPKCRNYNVLDVKYT